MDNENNLSNTAKKRLRRKKNRNEKNLSNPVSIVQTNINVNSEKKNSKERRKELRKLKFSNLKSVEDNLSQIAKQIKSNFNLDIKKSISNESNLNNCEYYIQKTNDFENVKSNISEDDIINEEKKSISDESIKTELEIKESKDINLTDDNLTVKKIMNEDLLIKDSPNINMNISNNYSKLLKIANNDNMNDKNQESLWCLHNDCLMSTDFFLNENDLENHMKEVHSQ